MTIHWRPLNPDEPGDQVQWRDIVEPTDYYETLQVSRNASPDIIKRAYRTLIEQSHPDKHPPYRKAWAEEATKQLNAAYAVLSHPDQRERYDRERGYRR